MGGARVSADAESNEAKPIQESVLATVLSICRGSTNGALVELRLEWNASWQTGQSPLSALNSAVITQSRETTLS